MQLDDKDLASVKARKALQRNGMIRKKISLPEFSEEEISENSGAPLLARISTGDKSQWIQILDGVFEWVLYGLIFLMPLFVLPFTNEPLELNKQMLLVGGTLFLALIGGARMMLAQTFELKLSSVYAGFGAVFIAWLVAAFASLYPYNSFMGLDRQEYMSVLTMSTLILFAVLCAQSSMDRILKSVGALLGSLAIASIFGILQLFGRFILPWDFTKSPSFTLLGSTDVWGVLAAASLVAGIGLVGYLSLSEYRYKLHASIALAVSTGIQLISLILLDDWRLWVGSIVGLLFILALLFLKLRSHKPMPWLILPSFALVLSLAFTFIHLPRVVDLPLSVQPTWKTSASLALQTLQHSPVWGFGPGNFLETYTQFRPKDINAINFLGLWSVRFDQASAVVFTRVAALGLLGLLAALTFLFLFGKKIWDYMSTREMDDHYLLLLSVTAPLLALGVLSFLKPANITLVFCAGLFVALALALLPKKEVTFSSENSNRFLILTSVLLSVLGVGVLLLAILGSERYSADIAFGQAIKIDRALSGKISTGTPLNVDDVDVLVNKLSTAVQRNPFNDLYFRTLSQALLYRITALSQQNPDMSAIQVTTEGAIDSAKKAIDLNPHDVRNYENLASTYQQIAAFTGGADSFAADAYKKAQALDPQNPSLPLNFAKMNLDMAGFHMKRASSMKDQEKTAETELATKSINEAEVNLKAALDLKPDLPAISYYLAVIRSQQGNKPEAIDLLTKAANLNAQLASARAADPGLFTLIATSFAALGEKDKALDSIRAGLSLRSDDIQALWIYANLLADNGKKDDAITILGKILEKDPKNEQVVKRIQELQGTAPTSQKPDATVTPPQSEPAAGAGATTETPPQQPDIPTAPDSSDAGN
ncbi:MAG: tetratricopeptide repeat protein [bacterium]|nr:tetratricopeptide repeat protein [bacterium]